MNNLRSFTTASILAMMGAMAVTNAAVAATRDENPAPSAIAAVATDPLLHDTTPSLLSNVPAATMYRAASPHPAHVAPNALTPSTAR